MRRFTLRALHHEETIAALATPAGTAALATLRISGYDTEQLARDLGASAPLPRQARYADYRARDGTLIDDVVFTYYPGPNSYTGENALEISCHGNPYIVQRILEDLYVRGCRPAEPGEFTQRAFLNGRVDLSQAEAVMDVIHARSERALAAAQQQLRGALGRRMTVLVDALLVVLARVEAYIDFPEEDLPVEDRAALAAELSRLAAETDRLLATQRYGALLRDGIKVVIVGNTNVGKSSLLNRMVGRDRALVSAEPGTTRDYIEERVVLGPHCFRFIDTAGLNASPGALEKLGIEKTLEQVDEADAFLVVCDAGETTAPPPASLLAHFGRANTIVLLNKVDIHPVASAPSWAGGLPVCRVSARTGRGFEELTAALLRLADQFASDVGEDTVAISARHAHALDDARAGLIAAQQKLASSALMELLASDLRAVLAAYGEITGKVDNERVLDELFATFCIGK